MKPDDTTVIDAPEAAVPEAAAPEPQPAEPSSALDALAGMRSAAVKTAAIAEEYLSLIRAVVPDDTPPDGERRAARPGRRMQAPMTSGTPGADGGAEIAVISLCGVITPRGSLFSRLFGYGSGGLEAFREDFREAVADDNVRAIVLNVDSPGGMVDLVPETAAEILAARGTKRIVAIANTMAGSAAYWIAAQADELVVTPSGQVGSVGVYTIHEDVSKLEQRIGIQTTLISAGKFKTEGNPWEPLSRQATQALQANVDDLYAMFVAAVAAGRGATPQAVAAGFGEGRMVLASRALALGMVDRVETFEQTLMRLGATPEEDEPEEAPEEPTDTGEDEPDDEPEEDDDDSPQASAESGKPADRLYGEDRSEQPAWLL